MTELESFCRLTNRYGRGRDDGIYKNTHAQVARFVLSRHRGSKEHVKCRVSDVQLTDAWQALEQQLGWRPVVKPSKKKGKV